MAKENKSFVYDQFKEQKVLQWSNNNKELLLVIDNIISFENSKNRWILLLNT